MKKIVLGILSSLILTTNVLANEVETKKVITTGTGLTESEALKDTTRNAVQQVVGAYILSDTYVKNFQLIKDEILTNSNGFVKSFKVISQTKDSAGIIRIEAEVEVEPNNVTKRLGELNIVLRDVGTTEFKAVSLDKFQASKDFKTMFDEIVLKPIKENKKIYDIKIGELKSVDKLSFYNKDDKLMPFILSFSVDFKKDYTDSVKSFLEKTSKQKHILPDKSYNCSSCKGRYVSFSNNMGKSWNNMGRSIPKIAYELSESLETSFSALINSMSIYKPSLMINFYDKSNNIIKNIQFIGYFGSFKKDNYYGDNSRLDLYDGFVFGFQGNSVDLDLLDFIKESKLEIYLSEEDVAKIKSSSIEIKWEKK